MDKYQLFKEFEIHLLNDLKPSIYLKKMAENGELDKHYPFTLLSGLRRIEQSATYHPEGNVWEHTMLVVDLAAEGRHISDSPRVFMWAALLHDLGKAITTKVRRGRITAYDHDRHGARLATNFLQQFSDDEDFIQNVSQLIRWHMQPLYINKRLPFTNIEKMLSEISLNEIALFSLCDRLGRGNMSETIRHTEIANIQSFVKQCECIHNQE